VFLESLHAIFHRPLGPAVEYIHTDRQLMRIDPANRVIEAGGIVFTLALQKTRGATEAMYLLAKCVFDDASRQKTPLH
jgi:hypothetical protein